VERWPGAVESRRAIALQVLRWLAEALLLALVTGTMALVLSQVVSLWKPLLRLPLALVLAVCALTLAVLWLAGRERAIRALRGSLWFMAVMAVAGVVVGVAVWGLGQYLSDRREPVTLNGLWAGFVIGAVVIWTVLTAATWLAWRKYTGTVSKRFAALAVLALMSLVVGFLTARAPRWELDLEGQEIRARGLGRIDVLLVVDPHDAAGRRLIAEAADRREELRARPPIDTARFDIAFGLAVLNRTQDPQAPQYRTVLSPGARSNFVDALAGVPPAEGRPRSAPTGASCSTPSSRPARRPSRARIRA
jgi:FtsH-binding integral membrane protein